MKIFNMIIFVIVKFFMTVLSNTLTIPSGVFGPLLSIGAVFGRLYATILIDIGKLFDMTLIECKFIFLKLYIEEGMYALLGAIAMFSAVT